MTIRTILPISSTVTHALVISATILLSILTCSVSQESQAQTKSPYSKDRLLTAIRTNTRTKELSTADFVGYIEDRGVDFQMTPQDEVDLRNAGAPPEMIAVISRNYRQPPLPKGAGSLTIDSALPGCRVFLNGQLRGVTNGDGILKLSPVKAGQYKITVKKENYEEQQRTVTVASRADNTESFALTPIKGTLTVVPNLAGAIVRIRDVDYPEGVRNLSLLPDEYEVRISKPGYKTVTRVVTIMPGQPFSLPVNLEVMRVEEMLIQGTESFRQRNYVVAIRIAREILSAKPEDPKANLLLGLSYFNSGNYEAAVGILVKSISLGEQVGIPVQRHTKFGFPVQNDNLTPGVLTIGKNLLEFRAAGGSSVFSVPFDKVYRVLQENNRGGRVQMKVGDPKKKKDDGKDHNFHPMQAGLRQVLIGGGAKIEIHCENCLPATQAIYQVVQQVKLSSDSGTPAKL